MYGMTAHSAMEKVSPARYWLPFSMSAIHAKSLLCCASASATNSESSPCSITLRLYSARRLRGVLLISASQASRAIFWKAGRNAVALVRLFRHERRLGKGVVDVIKDER